MANNAPPMPTAPPPVGPPTITPASPPSVAPVAAAKPVVIPNIGPQPASAPVASKPGVWKTGKATAGPPRLIINCVEGWGKTTLGSHAPSPAILMARGETGYETLAAGARVPEIPHMIVDDWLTTLATVRDVAKNPNGIKTLVLDALGGFERLCHEHVCQREYSGDWGESGFGSFKRGYETSITDWLHLTAALDQVRAAGVAVIFLAHVRVKPFDNPTGASFHRYATDCHDKTWAVTHKWADAVLFGTYKQALTKQGQKEKPTMHGGRERIFYTERSDAYDAKNRYGMPTTILIPDDHTQSWAALAQHIEYYNPKG